MDDARAQLLVKHDCDAIAYSTLQPGLEYFDTSFGYVAYRSVAGLKLTLGPPVCAAGDRLALAERFMREHSGAVFFYVPEDFARLLSGAMRSTGIGVDKVLPLGREALDTSKQVRGALKKAAAAGFTLERIVEPSAEVRAQVEQINARYLETCALPYEMKFLNRPMQLDGDPLGLHYALRWREDGVDAVRGYARLNPQFKNGKTHGYLLDILRFGRTKLWGVFYASVVHLARAMEAQGVSELSLGYCPLFRAQTHQTLAASASLDWQVAWLEKHLAQVPYVERLRTQKSAFPGEERQRYMVSGLRTAVRPFLGLMSASGVSLRSLLGKGLLDSVLAPYRKERPA